jgi:hypothetical protein
MKRWISVVSALVLPLATVVLIPASAASAAPTGSPVTITYSSEPTPQNAFVTKITIRADITIDRANDKLTLDGDDPHCTIDVAFGYGKVQVDKCEGDRDGGYDPISHEAIGTLNFRVDHVATPGAGFNWPSCTTQVGYSTDGTTSGAGPTCQASVGPPPSLLPDCRRMFIIVGPADCKNQEWYKSVRAGLESHDITNVRATIAALFAPYPEVRGDLAEVLVGLGTASPQWSCVQGYALDFAFRTASSRASIQDLQTVLAVARKVILGQIIPEGELAEKIGELLNDSYEKLGDKLLSAVAKAGDTEQARADILSMHSC